MDLRIEDFALEQSSFTDIYTSGHPRALDYCIRNVPHLDAKITKARHSAHANSDPSCDDFVLGLVTAGRTRVRWKAGGPWREQNVRKSGDMGITPFRTKLDIEVSGSYEIIVLSIGMKRLQGHFAQYNVNYPSHLGAMQGETYWRDPICEHLIRHVWAKSGSGDILDGMAAKAALDTLLLRSLELSPLLDTRKINSSRRTHAFDKAIAQRVEEALRSDLASPPDLSVICSDLDMSAFALRSAFRETFGSTLPKWLTAERIKEAKIALLDSKRSIADIATSLGFCDQSYFSNVFRDHTGFSPGNFRTVALQ